MLKKMKVGLSLILGIKHSKDIVGLSLIFNIQKLCMFSIKNIQKNLVLDLV